LDRDLVLVGLRFFGFVSHRGLPSLRADRPSRTVPHTR
jgi:hypothetical protein